MSVKLFYTMYECMKGRGGEQLTALRGCFKAEMVTTSRTTLLDARRPNRLNSIMQGGALWEMASADAQPYVAGLVVQLHGDLGRQRPHVPSVVLQCQPEVTFRHCHVRMVARNSPLGLLCVAHSSSQRSQCAVGSRAYGLHEAVKAIKGLECRRPLVRVVSVEHPDGDEAGVVVGEEADLGVRVHGLLDLGGGPVDVDVVFWAVEADGVLALDEGVGLEVEAGDDACTSRRLFSELPLWERGSCGRETCRSWCRLL